MVNFHLKYSSFGGFMETWPLVPSGWVVLPDVCLLVIWPRLWKYPTDWLTVGKSNVPPAWNVGLLLPLHKHFQDSWNWINPIIIIPMHKSSLDGCFIVWIEDEERWDDRRQWSRGWWLIWAGGQSKPHFPAKSVVKAALLLWLLTHS